MYKDLSLKTLSLPIFVQMLLSLSAGIIDTAMISKTGDNCVGSIGVATKIITFLTISYQIIASSSAIVVAQYLGASRKQDPIMDKIYTVAVMFNLILSVAVCTVVVAFAPNFLHLLNTPSTMVNNSIHYMKIVGCFLFCQSVTSVLVAIFNVHGKTYIGMLVFLSMDLLNIFGNWLFLFGPLKSLNLAIRGVAISTSFANIATMIAIIIAFRKIIGARINIALLFKRNSGEESAAAILKTLLKLGIPAASESFSYSAAQFVITGIVNTIGPIAVTTRVYCSNLMRVNKIYADSVAQGQSIITGQSVGAADYDFAHKSTLKSAFLALAVSVVVTVINFLLSKWTLALFTSNPDIIKIGRTMLFIACFLEMGRSLNVVIAKSMRTAGDVMFNVAVNITLTWLVSVLGAYVFGLKLKMGLPGVGLSMALTEIIAALIFFIRWQRGVWRGKSVVDAK